MRLPRRLTPRNEGAVINSNLPNPFAKGGGTTHMA